ncbi:MAG TPA: glutamate synthase large subunit [Candidatus Omnitrophota bacterium]|nr:glutamate synthase large subunit [Candidatus Omnitrophota bacterium]HPD84527.1 glutamate synthase large subunit [Candidatus Omnitrophota bacterium]HRZ03385.1 glutamate synthase large subunit [Candidatus Omnitrophota bacterium]
MNKQSYPQKQGLYNPIHEHDSCGVGFVVNIDGRQSHDIIERGIEVLQRLVHRGAAGEDKKTGDGAGILIQLPDAFLRRVCGLLKISLPAQGQYGVGMIFMPQEVSIQKKCQKITEEATKEEKLDFLGWRTVPVHPDALGEKARQEQPCIMQCFIGAGDTDAESLERKLYVVRKHIEHRIEETLGLGDGFYIASLSSQTIVYKGMMMGTQVTEFYQDLNNQDLVSAVAVIHQRYSTNTFPSWKLAQPFRYLAHNGEINTLRGNVNQMQAREKSLQSDLLGEDIKKILPIIDEGGSDSACLDNALELLTASGRDLPHAMMMLIPQAWGVKYPIGPDLKGFFEYHAGMMEPWDGPAAVAFTDGKSVGALLDRNGLRPARYTITDDGFMVLASETGVLDFPPEHVLEKGALRPGEIIVVDFQKKRVIKNGEMKTLYARHQPYRRWVEENKIELHGLFNDVAAVSPDIEKLCLRQRLFGYTREDLDIVIKPMAAKGNEAVGSMGCDTPLAVLSEKPQLLYSYFKQLFAQITNPPIDPIREELVMSLMTFMGNAGNILSEIPQNSRLIKLLHPILSNEDLERLQSLNVKGFWATTLQMGFPAGGSPNELEESLGQLCRTAEASVVDGCSLVILSDRNLPEHMVPIPALLAVSAVNRYLIEQGVRTSVAIIVETGEAREVQHMALLLGYGATAINPYLALETVADMAIRKTLDAEIGVAKALENYIHALCKGLLKVMSKMGISTLRSYRGAQVFEAIGINSDVIEKYFTGTASRIEGIGLAEIAAEAGSRHAMAYRASAKAPEALPNGGRYRYRKDGERHLWTPDSIAKLQFATKSNNYNVYKEYAKLINDQAKAACTLRGLFKFKKTTPIPVSEVEPAAEIVKRFVTSAMSFGSIGREAHETLAIAMNRIGAMSNSGEGGEDPERYKLLPNGDNRCSAVKQVASARFGVTAEYLTSSRELQIKIAQGAKPGEGGQLPGHKVNEEIARVRHSTPGVTLISPPPHHDIYSIEDIKQLIFDLKNVNPQAQVSVKLVSEVGVGTIAAGVAKAHADKVLISGYDGGTGASPISSIQHAGVPWELGVAETQQTLVLNNLRRRIRLQTDGQIKTGRDVIIAALLGAEEFGFATTPLVVCGCIMMRKCHLNTCPVGVATQDAELRKRFSGKPEHVVNFFFMVAEEIREYMAQLGFKRMEDMIGRNDLLETNEAVDFWKSRGLDFSNILFNAPVDKDAVTRCIECQEHGIEDVLDKKLIELSREALEKQAPVKIELPIRNTNLTTGAMLSGEVTRRYGSKGLGEDTIACHFKGAAGQSFGAFVTNGITLTLEGEANDYLGKGLCGGKIIVKPPQGIRFEPSENIICGNVLLYGATSGEAYIYGCVGERFAIRNSGAYAVVEGVGDHGCEYMTGGRVVVLGSTGVNFAAGMSGGIAYVYDPRSRLDGRCNLDMVDLELLVDQRDINECKGMIIKHLSFTGSKRARHILDHWEECLPAFVKVFPMEYRRVLGKMMKEDEATQRQEEEKK